MEDRQIVIAKRILESAGYSVREATAFANTIDRDILDTLEEGVPKHPYINNDLTKCSKSATANSLYYVDKGEEVTFFLGYIKEKMHQITHCWMTHNGEILQTRNSLFPDDLVVAYQVDLVPGDVEVSKKLITDLVARANHQSIQ